MMSRDAKFLTGAPSEYLLLATLGTRFISDAYRNGAIYSGSMSTTIVTALSLFVTSMILLHYISSGHTLSGGVEVLLLPGAFVAYVFVSARTGLAPKEGFNEGIRWLVYMTTAASAAVVFGRTTGARIRLCRFVTAAGCFEAVYGISQYLSGHLTPYQSGGLVLYRITGTFPHPAWLALFLVVALLVTRVSNLPRGLEVAIASVMAAAILLTFSRGPLVFGLVALVAVAVVSRSSRIILLTALIAAALFSIPIIRERFLSEISNGQLQGSYASRLYLRHLAFHYWHSSLAVGLGAGSFFASVTPTFFPTPLEAHSDLAKLLVDEGLVGAFLYYLSLTGILARLWHVQRLGTNPLAGIAAGLVAAVGLMGTVDSYHRLNTAMTYLWVIVAVGCRSAVSDRDLEPNHNARLLTASRS